MSTGTFACQTVPDFLLSIKLNGNLAKFQLIIKKKKKQQQPFVLDHYIHNFLFVLKRGVKGNGCQCSNKTPSASIYLYICVG